MNTCRFVEDRKDKLLPTYGKCCLRCNYEWLPRVMTTRALPALSFFSSSDSPRENRQGMRPGT